MMTFAYRVPNYIETYMRLRDVKKLVPSSNAFNQQLMELFIRLREQKGDLPTDQVSLEAAATLKSLKGNLTPFECEVVQARKADHHDMSWIQVVARMTIQDATSKLTSYYVTVETRIPEASHFRIIDLRPA